MRAQAMELNTGLGLHLLDQFVASRNAAAAIARQAKARALRVRYQGSDEVRPAKLTPALFARINLRHPDICERILGLHAGGYGAADIQSRVSMYAGETIPGSFVDATLADLSAEASDWRQRPLESCYPIVIFERMRIKVRDRSGSHVRNCHIAIGFQAHGPKEVLGFWFETGDETLFWRSVLDELRNRGVEDIIYLAGASDALAAELQRCFATTIGVPHVGDLVRQSQDMSTSKNRCLIARALRPLHSARTADEALDIIENLEASALARENPSILPIWRRHWAELKPFFDIAPEIRQVMTSTFAADGLRCALKKALSRRKYSTSLDEAITLMYLVARHARRKWKRAQREWHAAKVQLALHFPDRFCS